MPTRPRKHGFRKTFTQKMSLVMESRPRHSYFLKLVNSIIWREQATCETPYGDVTGQPESPYSLRTIGENIVTVGFVKE